MEDGGNKQFSAFLQHKLIEISCHRDESTLPTQELLNRIVGLYRRVTPSNKNSDCIYKILLAGESGSGKSCLLMRYLNDSFKELFTSTIGIDFGCKRTTIRNKGVKLQIWDTAGQERYRSIAANYFRGAQGILVVFDLTDPHSFKRVEDWLNDTQSFTSAGTPVVLVGNKSDKPKLRMVDSAVAKALADKWNIPYIETSAKVGTNVAKAFEKLATEIMDKNEKTVSTINAGDNTVENEKKVDLNEKEEPKKNVRVRGRVLGLCTIL